MLYPFAIGECYGKKRAHFINERKQVEANLAKSEKKYRALVETSSDFIWEVDQDGVYTYVSPKIKDILGYQPSEVIGKTVLDLMPGHEAERVYSINQMHQLIEDLLLYSRMERRDLNPSTLNIRRMIDELLLEREHEINVKSARITIDISHDHIVCDRKSIRQILGNFIDNAIKFTTDEAEPKIKITVSKSGDIWRFSVADNGIGFDSKYHDRIFGIFQHLHRAEQFPGTGVGLALVRRAASRMNGRTWAEGKPGQGATFHPELPEVQTNEAKFV